MYCFTQDVETNEQKYFTQQSLYALPWPVYISRLHSEKTQGNYFAELLSTNHFRQMLIR